MNLNEFKNTLQFFIVKYQQNKTSENLLDIEKLFEKYLTIHKQDASTLISFALFLYEDLHDDIKALGLLKNVLLFDPENISALLLMSYISFNFLHMDENFILEKLLSFVVEDSQLMALVNYVIALHYRGRNEELVKCYLEVSVECWDGFVWNNYKLGEIYMDEGNLKKAKELTEKAINNIQYIYPYPPSKEYTITPVEEFIKERLKGIHITQPNLEIMQEQLEEINQKL